ncbi:MAG: Rrf2 family transcriptional regulator [Spirochaetales bacterium]|nr:MAG: Rrf2 family transcriptional regulator [Spirochaetales bacterium]
MKLSTRSRYGARLMFELAINHGSEFILLKDIARRQDISEKYLSKLIIPLRGTGLVQSARGHHGGYRLAKEPGAITFREIVELLEGDIVPVECVKDSAVCDRVSLCPTRDVWCMLSDVILDTLESITLKDIVERFQSRPSSSGADYCI